MRYLASILTTIVLATTAFSQSTYISDESFGEKPRGPEVNKDDPFTPLPVKSWVGEKFIFMPMHKLYTKEGYIVLPESGVGIEYIPYDRYKGKIFTVLSIEETEGYSSNYHIAIRLDETGEKFILPTMFGNIRGIALKRDIDYARNKYLRETLWLRNREASSYDVETDKTEFFKVKNLQPVTVKNILLSDTENWPLRFILENSEGHTFIKVAKMSGTNSGRTSRNTYKFKDVFFIDNPRETFDWSEKVFQAIEDGNLMTGMTKEQVRVSWGNPLEINRTVSNGKVLEQWVYGGRRYLYFDGMTLTGMQE